MLLFDLGGVLMDFAGFEEMRELLPGSPTRTEVRDRWIHSSAVQRFERGEITPQHFADGVIEELKIDLTPPDFLLRFVEWAREPTPEAISLLMRLRGDFRLAALSNANELHTPLHRRRFEHAIDALYFSDEIGAVKPDRAIFEHVIDDLGVPPDRIAFFDDTPVNIEVARKTGIRAYATDGLAELTNRLQQLALFDEGYRL